MTARTNTSSGPKADGSHPDAYAILSGVAVGLFLPVIGLLLDSHDTYFNVLLPASFAGGAIVAFFVWRRERQTSFFQPRRPFESGYERNDPSKLRPKDVWTPESKHLVPSGPGGVGQWTAHPTGLSAHGLSFSNPGECPHAAFASWWRRCGHLFVAISPIAKSEFSLTKIGLMVKHTNRLTSETVAWRYLIGEAIAGAVFLLLSAYEIFFRK